MKNHRHQIAKSEDFGFSGAVAQPENQAAHGNICRVDTCRCGATRRTNINQSHVERGQWTMPGADVQATRNPLTGAWTPAAK